MSLVSMMLSCAVALASVAAPVTSEVYCDVSTARLTSVFALSCRPLTAPLSPSTSSLLSFAPPKRPEKKLTTGSDAVCQPADDSAEHVPDDAQNIPDDLKDRGKGFEDGGDEPEQLCNRREEWPLRCSG